MRVSEVLAKLRAAGVVPTGISADSRHVGTGEVFAAWPGAVSDGRRYLDAAIAHGAAAVLYEGSDGFRPPLMTRPAIAVDGLRDLAGDLAHEICGHPSEKLWMAGVTGTNGKTTISQWLAQALGALDTPCGVIGTLGSGFPGVLTAGLNTTPDALEVHRTLAGFEHAGARAAAMEVSSIGLDQGRVNGVQFDVAVFTNLTRDHIDYHGSMEAYAAAKARLFDSPGLGRAVINLDDEFGLEQAQRLAARGDMHLIGYTTAAQAATAPPGVLTLVGDNVRASAAGLRFDLVWDGQQAELDVRLVGTFNVSNLLAVIGSLLHYGVAMDDIVRVVQTLSPPPGRMQRVGGEGEPLVVVDYAHTPDALAKVLDAVRGSARARGGRLICVFGCGGDRDAGKRPQMGAVASRLADRVIVTSDNPRSEAPQKIIDAILAGAGPKTETLLDRGAAIRTVVSNASAHDVIVIAGKGHEPYQEIRGERRPFSDLEQATQALAAWRGRVAA
ncbi:UDP-N-acetylmuramoyl-L-alanyl-D-glutamate--2,6-diaminopimelate ligase [Betaproteobacteria bacterium]|nr:UDP-N-acetylmuramoyl-L-alanyl-D-glutamate--2,6-diaminopimelate ligase [Betaproteobacteria bacterium]GHU00727.1 UDP-N-acetylmuramoyl-L-alanyl-D-glutamate--2,6-diaminopimelate ligase [Betaproteobacteria bacterium]GHU17624.1 UDP-N-acetylmuramoyl-L-alanyl-D-glutamate--2,6-diaminopimelate ligase [Betaproteobacteria bacterium]